jgi:hypothetical protein
MSWSFLFTLGAALGVVFGLTNILVAALSPFMEDTPLALLSFYGPMFVAWGVTGREAFRRTRRVGQAAIAGGTVAFATFVVFTIIVVLRMNLTLDTIVERPDWRNMVANSRRSNFDSFRAYANYVYLTGAPFKIAVAATIGTVSGLIGGMMADRGPAAQRP